MAKTRFFRVALEGATTDGRSIEKQWLIDAAQTYNRETYAARVNMEHIRGITADKPFKSYGDVLSLKTEEVEIQLAGKTETRLALFAELDVTDELIAINRDKQKLYTSIEINPNFAGTGKAYLVGLAVTDSPASLGTEMLTFAASQGEKNPLAARKQDPDNIFTAADEAVTFEIETEEDAATQSDATAGLFAKISAFVDSLTGKTAAGDGDGNGEGVSSPPSQGSGADTSATNAAGFAAIGLAIGELAQAVKASNDATAAQISQLTSDLKSVTEKVEKAPATGFTSCDPATGGETAIRTDC